MNKFNEHLDFLFRIGIISFRIVMGLIGTYLVFKWITVLVPNWYTVLMGFMGIFMIAYSFINPDFSED
jgi:hypothetical protein